MISLTNLSHALALREYGNFRRAAAAQHISQPAFSRSIQKLEMLLGVKLFDRHSGKVVPTLYGESLLRHAESIFSQTSEMEREIDILKGLKGGNFSVAMGNYVSELSGSQAIGELIHLHPNIHFQAKVANWRTVTELLLSCSVDLGISEISFADNIKTLKTVSLAEKQLLLFCRPGHPLLKLRKVSRSDLDHYPLAMLRMPPRVAEFVPGKGNLIDKKTGDVIPSIEIDELATARAIVKVSDAFGMTTAVQIKAGVDSGEFAILPFQAPWLKLVYGFIYLRGRLLSPVAEVYMQLIKDIEKVQTKKNNQLIKKLLPNHRAE